MDIGLCFCDSNTEEQKNRADHLHKPWIYFHTWTSQVKGEEIIKISSAQGHTVNTNFLRQEKQHLPQNYPFPGNQTIITLTSRSYSQSFADL